MASLAILQADARAAARLSAALGDAHRVTVYASWRELERAVEAGLTDGCLLDADHPTRAEASERISGLRRLDPGLAIIAYIEFRHSDGYYDLGERGVDGVVTASTPQNRLRSEVDAAFSVARGGALARKLRGRVRAPVPEALAWSVAHASHETSVEKLASALGLSPRALREVLSDAGLPPPAKLLLWGRLLLAGARLGADGRTVEEVAFSVGYATATSLARAMKLHTGLTPGQVAEKGGMDAVEKSIFASGMGPGGGLRKLAAVALAVCASSCASLGLGPGADVHRVLESPGLRQMHVGVLAVDAESGRTLFALDEEKKFVPASNQKILVTAAAMSMLGPDHRFRTEAWATGPIIDGRIDGDLVVVGSGDPTLSHRYWESGTAALEALADSLRARGVVGIEGALVIDVSAWDSATVGPTWEVEDLRYAYGSTGGAFAIDEGEIEVVLTAGASIDDPATVTWSPVGTEGFVRSEVTTAPADSAGRVVPHYLPESRLLVLGGEIEVGAVDTLRVAARDPVRQASAALAAAVEREGIEVRDGWRVRWANDGSDDAGPHGEGDGSDGGGCAQRDLAGCPGATLVAALESPRLVEIVEGILEPSQNWMTEQLIRALAAYFGEEGSWSVGVDLVEAFITEHVAVDTLDVAARDGSGLSAYNLVTPRALVRVLRYMHDGPYAAQYRAALAEPGEEESSLEERLLDLEGHLWAKTGTISNVNSLSGYLVREDGREVVFSILTNGSGLPSSYVRSAIDDIVRTLAR
jgi:D-alanyl-D-alanine carboxypeptidase/D-alanyl-D-alanine-endopeptidase (penicillin-binding protein 4)